MIEKIDLKSNYIKETLPILLEDKTTGKNIIWATKSYEDLNAECRDDAQMDEVSIVGVDKILLQPRIAKALEQQQERTKSHAEVFTPSWVCNKMNNFCDEEWFGRKDVFNAERGTEWETVTETITFPKGKTWKDYVDSRRLEITCGEAPFIVSRYDTSTGEEIPVLNRIGLLDRKLRVVCENTKTKNEWFEWVVRAYQSVYGYEYQGDNLLIARLNLIETYVDYLEYKWQEMPEIKDVKKLVNIIAWNFWQMDGLSGTVPLGVPEEPHEQLAFGGFEGLVQNEKETPKCRIYDWRGDRSIPYERIREEA